MFISKLIHLNFTDWFEYYFLKSRFLNLKNYHNFIIFQLIFCFEYEI